MTTTAPALIALADRCEAATGPDRELDAEIHAAIFGGVASHLTKDGTRKSYGAGSVFQRPDAPTILLSDFSKSKVYTASIDSAMTLVADPIYSDWSVERDDDIYRASIHAPHGERQWVQSATPALALCAAALRSLAAGASS